MFKVQYIPNLITITRILFLPYLVWMLFHQQFERSLLLMLFIGVSDGLDGFLARRYHWETKLGGYLDPIADKIMLVSVYVTFAVLNWIPWWLAAIIVARDAVLLLGAFSYHLVTKQLQMEPLLISKVNTFMQILLAVSLIYSQVNPLNPQLLNAMMAVTLCTTIASGIGYVLEWSKRAVRACH